MKIHSDLFYRIISLENLFASWHEFRQGKRKKYDVQVFERNLEDNLFTLHAELKDGAYRHSQYTSFYITDPKVRHIHKAEVRDRVVHHAIYRILYPIFDKGFIYDSYSCRLEKGTHRAVDRLESFIRKVSLNFTGSCLVLKCDIKKFFDSVDHEILLEIIKRKIDDQDLLWLLTEVIESFHVKTNSIQPSLFAIPLEREREREQMAPLFGVSGRGIPIGNLTSQLFANIYMNELDQFVKHKLKAKYYIRYADDFIIVSDSSTYLENLLPEIQSFLGNKLKLGLHPGKVSIRKLRQGIDFLGYVVLPHYRVLRTKTKRRMFKKIKQRATLCKTGLIDEKSLQQSIASYLGVFSHADSYEVVQDLARSFPSIPLFSNKQSNCHLVKLYNSKLINAAVCS